MLQEHSKYFAASQRGHYSSGNYAGLSPDFLSPHKPGTLAGGCESLLDAAKVKTFVSIYNIVAFFRGF